MKKIIEVVKNNKENIIKGALLVGGSVLAAVVANAALNTKETELEFLEIEEHVDDLEAVEVEPSEEE